MAYIEIPFAATVAFFLSVILLRFWRTVMKTHIFHISRRLIGLVVLTVVMALTLQSLNVTPASAQAATPLQWCKGVTIRYFVGGDAGDAFASIVYKGAQAAQADLGPKVDFVFSGWQPEKMVSQLRDAIAAKPDGIAMMGHPGDDAIMPLAQQASQAGILMEYQNVDVPKV